MNKLILTKKRQAMLESVNVYNLNDLMAYYPMRYEVNRPMKYSELIKDQRVCIIGRLVSFARTSRFGRMAVNNFQVLLDDEIIKVAIYNRPWLRFDMDHPILIVGKYIGNNKIQATNAIQNYSEDRHLGIVPIYHLSADMSQNDIRNIMLKNQELMIEEAIDIIPSSFLLRHQLCTKKEAITGIHFPKDHSVVKRALAYLKYEEFLKFYTVLALNKQRIINHLKEKKEYDLNKVEAFIDRLKFKLTDDQSRALNDILNDLRSDKLMYRLLCGDVGSGKTIVAAIALYANSLAGYQGVMMVPTEILAKQHYHSFKELFNDEISIEVLYSSISNIKKKEIVENLASGKIDILIGTHALFQETLNYHNLGLIITDEQHRFGVRQRQELKTKGKYSDFLSMSATPIPRTLASAIYGDIDVSTIVSMPKERKGCSSYLLNQNSITTILKDLINRLANHEQIYVVASSIEDNELKTKSVLSLYEHLKQLFKPYAVNFIHGKMSTEEKDRVMNDFIDNKIQVLVSTTVIEVGVNVKNATTMVVYDAERFGLSQLHQLRGRIQRGNLKGYFYMLTNSKDPQVLSRLKVIEGSNDGFKIAYEDLKLRGPGDMLGIRQSGLPGLVLGNLFDDQKIIEAAKKDANEIVLNHELVENKEFIEYLSDNYLQQHID